MKLKRRNDSDTGYNFIDIDISDVYMHATSYNGSFGNCQNFTIRYFNELLVLYKNSPKLLSECLYKIYTKFSRPYCVIDINKNVYEDLKNTIKENNLKIKFVVDTPYINANGSNMVICILDLSELEIIENNEVQIN